DPATDPTAGPATDPADAELDRALDAWTPLAPPAEFAARVLAARDAAAPTPPPRRRRRFAIAAVAAAAAAVAALALRPPHATTTGAVIADRRTTAALGDRGIAVAEPASELTWRIDERGAADVVQRSGDVFYRVERGGPFVVHTPAGDVRVTGTCFRIEVEAMKPSHKLLLSGLAGAATAAIVLVTVYEGHVIAETRAARTELAAGSRATLTGDATTVAGGAPAGLPAALIDDAHVTREQLVLRSREQQVQLAQLRARVAELERTAAAPAAPWDHDVPEPGRTWYDPSPELLASWVATCHVRIDEPALDRFVPGSEPDSSYGLKADELPGFNAALTETQQRWKALVRSLYLELTGDAAGADALSSEAMRREIDDKSPPGEHNAVLQRIARERAGLAEPPADLARSSPLERLTRAYVQLGDQSEAAVAKRFGAERAHAIRGNGWGARWETSGCPSPSGK
ncbi:MAG TPA: hypothetical protein VK601_13660, partial [Kofleriaceae bacterium]|nr:hypothetical protein [Kofleriaceae bacterium]